MTDQQKPFVVLRAERSDADLQEQITSRLKVRGAEVRTRTCLA